MCKETHMTKGEDTHGNVEANNWRMFSAKDP